MDALSHPRWYVDIILNLIRVAGDSLADVVWYRAIKIITNEEDVQAYAVRVMLAHLMRAPTLNAAAVKVGAYLLGEYGNLVENETGT